MGDTCNKLLEPEDVTVGATVGKYLVFVVRIRGMPPPTMCMNVSSVL